MQKNQVKIRKERSEGKKMQVWRMRTMKGNKITSQLLRNEHWKHRKQRLKLGCKVDENDELSAKSCTYKTSNLNAATTSLCDQMIDSYHPENTTVQINLHANNNHNRTSDIHMTKRKALTLLRPLIILYLSIAIVIVIAPARHKLAKASSQSALNSDPRPTIYSGQVSFGLLLSAHSSHGSELATAASNQRVTSLMLEPPPELQLNLNKSTAVEAATAGNQTKNKNRQQQPAALPDISPNDNRTIILGNSRLEPQLTSESVVEEVIEVQESQTVVHHALGKRQIFEHRRGQPQRRQQQMSQVSATNGKVPGEMTLSQNGGATDQPSSSSMCGQVNANSLYAGMGAIWASHQANLVGDSHLAIGTYVYDSCNDLDVGQRQSVRIVSNLNAFQQTTCEAPRGSPISLTIAHGDNQLRAIQLLTSFRVPVITTREHFALEDYHQLTRDQRRFLFTTAPSSRHLALGALRFSKKIVSHSTNSAKLPNQFYKMSPKNGLIVVSRNLPTRFISFLTEMIPREVNYEILYSSHPIDQIRSVEALESVLIKSSSLSSESKLSQVAVEPPPPSASHKSAAQRPLNLRGKRSTMDSSDSDSSDSGEYDSSGGDGDTKMLSPTILMFITPSEAIDLVTRLRNDLAEVSKYYSLIVSTREDITPALRTIFHRGGARLCSGKAFYTISPKPDDIGEFSRYFRDTVQMEGENSDHPLICEFAKYQSTSRINADLDDSGAEPVIKAVWSAAAAFKSVHRRECASLASSDSSMSPGASSGNNQQQQQQQQQNSAQGLGNTLSGGRIINSRQSNKSAHAECMVRMNKNMSFLVQKALKRLDVTINSTGLQALDGFRLKFDDLNELMTNKFSIRYINKECEITDIGHYTGLSESKLSIDQESFNKSLEGSMPDPWPVAATPAKTGTPSTTTRTPVSSNTSVDSSSTASDGKDAASPGTDSGVDSESGDASIGRGKDKGALEAAATSSNLDEPSKQMDEGDEQGGGGGEDEPRSRTRKRSKAAELDEKYQVHRSIKILKPSSQQVTSNTRAAPVTATSGGRGLGLGVTDTELVSPYDATVKPTRPATTTTATTSTATTSTSSTTTKQSPTTTKQSLTSTETKPEAKQSRKIKTFSPPLSSAVKDWLPGSLTLDSPLPVRTPLNYQRPAQWASDDGDQLDSGDLKVRATTQAPMFRSTLPESDGNADLEVTPFKSPAASRYKPAINKGGRSMDTAASTTTQDAIATTMHDYVTSPSINKGFYNQYSAAPQPPPTMHQTATSPVSDLSNFEMPIGQPMDAYAHKLLNRSTGSSASRINDMLSTSPIPLTSSTSRPGHSHQGEALNLRVPDAVSDSVHSPDQAHAKTSHSKLRSHIKWIYSSWYALSILGANITGALLTLYVLTFLLMKNCDGSLDRDNQGVRSMHLLAIIIVFFGSTLFIVYPTPGLCLLRTSWHNFALVMLFGSLLVQAMQTRSLATIGLGGRPNRVNQFLTLVFMVGVQIAFELQRWKYESANYLNFVNQYFGSSSGKDDERKLMILNSAISDQFNPLNSFNDQVTPVSIQISEHYQSLLQDYCLQRVDDFIQSQLYLSVIVALLVVFSTSNRRNRVRLSVAGVGGGISASTNSHKLAGTLTSGKMIASQHEANLNLSPSHFQFATQAGGSCASNQAAFVNTGNIFLVTILSAFIYSISIVLHIYGQNYASNRDLISSVTMVLIAFTALIGIFLPILLQIHRQDGNNGGSSSSNSSHQTIIGSLTRPMAQSSTKLQDHNSAAFALFPEFAPTGVRRLSSTSGDSDSGAGSRRTFAETRESRRNMGAVLANLGPSADSLRGMGFYNEDNDNNNNSNNKNGKVMDPALLNHKLNRYSSGSAHMSQQQTSNVGETGREPNHGTSHQNQHQQAHTSRKIIKGGGEKRLIMLDVDPCCPRHGIGNSSSSRDHHR